MKSWRSINDEEIPHGANPIESEYRRFSAPGGDTTFFVFFGEYNA